MEIKVRSVLFFIGSLSGGGGERVLLYILQHVSKLNISVTLLLFKEEGEYRDSLPDNVKIVTINSRRNVIFRSLEIASTINKVRPDRCVSFMTPANISLMRAAMLIKNSKFVINIQNNLTANSNVFRGGTFAFLRRMEVKFLYSRADLIIAASYGIADSLERKWKLRPDRIKIIQNPVDYELVNRKSMEQVDFPWRSNEGSKVIIAIGRLVEQKAYSDMLKVFSRVCEKSNVDCKLLILGQGIKKEEIEREIFELGLSNRVVLLGFTENPWAYAAKADLYLSTSHWEGLPLTLLEVLALGIPTVCTDCDFGPREVIINEEIGSLVPVGNIEVISDKVISVLHFDEERRRKSYKAAKHRARSFDTAPYVERYIEVLSDLNA